MDWFLYDRDLRHEGVNDIAVMKSNTLYVPKLLPFREEAFLSSLV